MKFREQSRNKSGGGPSHQSGINGMLKIPLENATGEGKEDRRAHQQNAILLIVVANATPRSGQALPGLIFVV